CGLEHLACAREVWLSALRLQAIGGLGKRPELMARLLHLTPRLFSGPCSRSGGSAVDAPNEHRRAAPPEVCGTHPVSPTESERCKVAKRPTHLGVVRAKSPFADCKRTLVQRLGFGLVALGLLRHRDVVQGDSNERVVGPQSLLPDRDRPEKERLGVDV